MKLNEERNTESFELWMMETSIWVKCYDDKWYNQSAVNKLNRDNYWIVYQYDDIENKQALFDEVLPAGNPKRASVSTRRTIKPNRMIVWQLFVGVRISLVVSPTPARAAWGLLFFKPQKTLKTCQIQPESSHRQQSEASPDRIEPCFSPTETLLPSARLQVGSLSLDRT